MTGEPATLIVLTGGESKRMGKPKHLLPTPAGTVIEVLRQRLSPLFLETLVVGGEPTVPMTGARTIEDRYPARGPLVGIYTGLLCAKTDLSLVVACDMPFVQPALARALLSHAAGVDVVVVRIGSYYEPLFAVYRRSALPIIREALGRGEMKVTGIYSRLRLHEVSEREARTFDSELASFVNLNTPRELGLLVQLKDADPAPGDLVTAEPRPSSRETQRRDSASVA